MCVLQRWVYECVCYKGGFECVCYKGVKEHSWLLDTLCLIALTDEQVNI